MAEQHTPKQMVWGIAIKTSMLLNLDLSTSLVSVVCLLILQIQNITMFPRLAFHVGQQQCKDGDSMC